jgi:nitrite reductase (NO-forming)
MKTYRVVLLFALVLGLIAPVWAATKPRPPASYQPDVNFTLRTAVTEGKLAFVGVGGKIDGAVNPTLNVAENAVVQIVLINGDGATHDIALTDFNTKSNQLQAKDSSTAIVFRATKSGAFPYFCTLPGHRAAGMEGKLMVGVEKAQAAPSIPSVTMDPAAVPAPIGKRGPTQVRVDLETVELQGRMADGSSYHYWTFNGKVPGPFLRVRVGDRVHVTLKNNAGSAMIHSVDFHAVTGPGGGAVATQTTPGGETSFDFKAMNPGIYVYHCATPMVAQHIANGMYGLILVEPEGGLPKVDREFYVMQGELYTRASLGQLGNQEFSVDKLLAERPEYFVFNGAVGALTKELPMKAKVGETVRIYFGVGGPNFISSLHLIGEIFDRVYNQGSLTSPASTDVQTTLVPAGGATMVELKLDVPGRYILVDHALSRLERGLAAFLIAEGPDNPEVFKADHISTAGH